MPAYLSAHSAGCYTWLSLILETWLYNKRGQTLAADRIILEGMLFYGYHGNNVEERSMGQPFQVDLEIGLDLRIPGQSDRLEDTVSYTQFYRITKNVLEGTPRNLLEAVAEEISQKVLDFQKVESVLVRVKKTRPPINGIILSGSAVQLYRTRE